MLHELDVWLMERVREGRCPYCKGPLHLAMYQRKAYGNRVDLPDEYRNRYSLCCGNPDCRRRVLPPSSLFMGRRSTYQCAILVGLTLWQSGQKSAQALSEMLDVDVRTIFRWAAYFRDVFLKSPLWQTIRGRVPAEIHMGRFPGLLLTFFVRRARDALNGVMECIRFLLGMPDRGHAW